MDLEGRCSGYHTYELVLPGNQNKTGYFTNIAQVLVSETLQPVAGTGGAMIIGLVGIVALGMIMTAKPKVPK